MPTSRINSIEVKIFLTTKKKAGLMAYKVIWSPAARDDLHDIIVFIRSMTAKEIVLETIGAFAGNWSQEEVIERTT